MAIDTETKRISSAGFGQAWRSGTRKPSGSSTAFLRGSVLATWYFEPITDPCDGWIPASRERVLISDSRDRVMISSTRNRVWIAGAN